MITSDRPGEMNNRRLQRLIEQVATSVDGKPGYWRFEYKSRQLVAVSTEEYNRMRVMTPIVDDSQVSSEELRILLSANYDRAIDAKFAIAEDYLWALFNHPLRELTEGLFLDAVEQVKTLADNYGGSYASSSIVFSGE